MGKRATDRKVLRPFKAADTDKSGAIDFKKFMAAMQWHAQAERVQESLLLPWSHAL
jgi:Ca2+-binding EF-hand superfamily protein